MPTLTPSDRRLQALAVLLARANGNAKSARTAGERERAARIYRQKDRLMSQAILRLPSSNRSVRFHLHDLLGVEVLLHLPLPGGKLRSFHVPFQKLSAPARAAVRETLGEPRAFATSPGGSGFAGADGRPRA